MAKGKQSEVSGGIAIDTDVPLPSFKRQGPRAQLYPFDDLQVGNSFHIPKTEENPDPVARVRSSMSNARDKWAEVVTDANGEAIMVERNTRAGKNLYPKKINIRDFGVKEVGAEDPRGPGARVFRTR